AGDLGRTPFGIDVNQEFLRHARAVAHATRADGAALPFASDSFEFVLLRLVLRHAPEREGIVAAIDVDEGTTVFDPEPPSWPALKKALVASAIRRGGDPFVGGRLRRLLLERGLSDSIDVALPVTTDDLAAGAFVQTLLAPAARVVDPDLMPASAVAAAWSELSEWASVGTGFGYALGFMAAARKPNGWRARAVA